MSDRPKRLVQQKDKTKEKDSKDEPTQTLQEDELSQALGTLKRKQQEDDGLLILQEKVKNKMYFRNNLDSDKLRPKLTSDFHYYY